MNEFGADALAKEKEAEDFMPRFQDMEHEKGQLDNNYIFAKQKAEFLQSDRMRRLSTLQPPRKTSGILKQRVVCIVSTVVVV